MYVILRYKLFLPPPLLFLMLSCHYHAVRRRRPPPPARRGAGAPPRDSTVIRERRRKGWPIRIQELNKAWLHFRRVVGGHLNPPRRNLESELAVFATTPPNLNMLFLNLVAKRGWKFGKSNKWKISCQGSPLNKWGRLYVCILAYVHISEHNTCARGLSGLLVCPACV